LNQCDSTFPKDFKGNPPLPVDGVQWYLSRLF
jgi:hypothetical protein